MSDELENENDGLDSLREFLEQEELATNDAVAGETVEPGTGEGNNGPTGGSPREFEPELDEHRTFDDPNDAPADLDDGSGQPPVEPEGQ
jgi:hypothetical protein